MTGLNHRFFSSVGKVFHFSGGLFIIIIMKENEIGFSRATSQLDINVMKSSEQVVWYSFATLDTKSAIV